MLEWAGISLLDHMVQLLSTAAERVRVVGQGDLPDRISGKGPLGGILTALQTTDSDLNIFLAVDLPLLTPEFLKMFQSRLVAASSPILACRIGDKFPLCLGIHRSLARDISRRIADDQLAIQSFVEDSGPEVINVAELEHQGFETSMFTNINTPEDWKKLAERP